MFAPFGGFEKTRRYLKRLLMPVSFYRQLYLAYSGWKAYNFRLPKWHLLTHGDLSFVGQDGYKPGSASARILIATGTSGNLPSVTIESLLGVALDVRGHNCDLLICDGVLPACMMCEGDWYPSKEEFVLQGPLERCKSCYLPSKRMLTDAGLKCLGLGDELIESEYREARNTAETIGLEEIETFTINDVAIGEHAMAGSLRFYARGDLPNDSTSAAVLRRYFEAALLTYFATRRLLAKECYHAVVLNHGIYVPQGVIAETARKLGLRVVTWHPAYKRGCFIFNHDETYHHGLLTEPTANWEGMHWTDKHKRQIETYLYSRWEGKQDWVRFHCDPELDCSVICRETGVDFLRPTIGLLTNVVWDAQLHYPANAFHNMLDWLLKTIAYFEARPDLQLLIRVHPAEITGTVPSKQRVVEEIQRVFHRLPQNVFVIPPESHISTYVAMSKCNAVVIYGTKTGVELTAMGIPVIVAGEAWIRGKSVTMDASSESDYFRLLDALPLPTRLDTATQERALKYAYHFFMRRMIPIDCVKERRGWPPFGVELDSLSNLLPGQSKGLDVVCRGILEGAPFIYPAEELVE